MGTESVTDVELETLAADSSSSIRALAEEVRRLRAAIKKHQSASGHELCWLNDVELWRSISNDPTYPHESLPVREEFLKQCERYHSSRLSGSAYEEPRAKRTISPTKPESDSVAI